MYNTFQVIEEFLDRRCVIDPSKFIGSSEFYKELTNEWQEKGQICPITSNKDLSMKLKSMGFMIGKKKNYNCIIGLGWKSIDLSREIGNNHNIDLSREIDNNHNIDLSREIDNNHNIDVLETMNFEIKDPIKNQPKLVVVNSSEMSSDITHNQESLQPKLKILSNEPNINVYPEGNIVSFDEYGKYLEYYLSQRQILISNFKDHKNNISTLSYKDWIVQKSQLIQQILKLEEWFLMIDIEEPTINDETNPTENDKERFTIWRDLMVKKLSKGFIKNYEKDIFDAIRRHNLLRKVHSEERIKKYRNRYKTIVDKLSKIKKS